MSKYTTEVRFICENAVGLVDSKGYNSVNQIVADARTKVFDFSYPIYDEAYRPVLETKILKHFYTREIGAETVGLWKLWLDTRMNEIMPYYNQLYKSAMLEFNPLYDVDITTQGGRDGKTDSTTDVDTTNNSNTTNDGSFTGKVQSGDISHSTTGVIAHKESNDDTWNEFSDTPQGGLSGIANHTYLTNATHNVDDYDEDSNQNTTTDSTDNVTTDTTNTTHDTGTFASLGSSKTTGNVNNTENYIERVVGKRGGHTYSEMIEKYRKILINIDIMIIHDLDDLFFNLW